MLILQVGQLHTEQRTGRSLMSFSTVAAPACFVASLPQEAKNLSHEAPKQGWHSEAGKRVYLSSEIRFSRIKRERLLHV